MLSGQSSWNPEDTIIALATPPGPSERAIVRLSGPRSHQIVQSLFQADPDQDLTFPVLKRIWAEGALLVIVGTDPPTGSVIQGTFRAAVHFWPAGRGFTRQESAEIHLPGCPPLVELLLEEGVRLGARLARPGEFSMRAFLGGQIDLSQAEAIVSISSARTPMELRFAMERLAGGIRHPVEELRSDLLDLLADLEAGLDFADEDISFVDSSTLLLRLGSGIAKARNLRRRMVEKDANAVRPMVALAGPPNAGKSTLFNLLAQNLVHSAAIVSSQPGTTRDWLVARGRLPAGTEVDWVDTAGLGGDSVDDLDEKARRITRALLPRVDLVVVCHPALEWQNQKDSRKLPAVVSTLGLPRDTHWIPLITRSDEAPDSSWEFPAVSALNRTGLSRFLNEVERHLMERGEDRLPPLARCQAHFGTAENCLKKAHEYALDNEPNEVVILELRAALDAFGEMTGALHTDDLLDRVFTRFCIGK